jgi:hypothetical protein
VVIKILVEASLTYNITLLTILMRFVTL